MEELKKCPFCGGEAKVRPFLHQYVIGCTKCSGAMMPFNTKEEAITAWNTRKPMDRIVKRLEQQAHQYKRRSHEVVDKNTEAGIHNFGKACSYEHAIEIVKEELN